MTTPLEVEHCPNCGAPLELDDQGCCHFCGEHVTRSVTLDGLALPDPDGSIAKLAGHDQLALDAPGDVQLPLPAMPILAALDLLGFNPVVQGYLGDPRRAAAVRALAAAVREAGARVRHAGLADDVVTKGQKLYTPTEWWTFELAVDVLAACGALDGLDEDDQDSVRETVRLHDDMWARRTHRVLKHAEAGPEPLASLRAEIPHRH